jgi:glycosyltransferase involved in cell wall biosynthesis
VVPNYFDQKDFLDATKDVDQAVATYLKDKPMGPSMKSILSLAKGSYVVFIGRIIPTKGIQTAIEVCRAAGIKLVIAGQGSIQDAVQKDFKVTLNGPEAPNGLTHVGYIEPSERAVLIARAKCIICPTLYAEPFGGVNVEAQMSGIPVITTDWGGFAETVDHGLSGYRCRSMDHFSWALKNVDLLDRTAIRDRAIKNYGFTKVASMYEEYFKMISTTQKRGFYQENVGRLSLKWLDKY